MLEGIRIISAVKKLTTKPSRVPGHLVTEFEDLAKRNYFSIEDVAVMIIQTAIERNHIDREELTPRGEMLLSEVGEHESDDD